ncbi:MAG: hypothetical protein WKF81_07120 [Thermomicrobiales bacterium]
MATTYQTPSTRNSGFRLGSATRKSVLIIHIVSSVGWMGLDIALAFLLLTALWTDSGVTAASSYNAVAIFAPISLLVLSALMLISGLVLGWGTKWGLIHYWWVFVKLLVALLMTGLVWFSLAPELTAIETQQATLSADEIRQQLGSAPTQLLFPPFVSFALLGISVVLSKFKPWGKTGLNKVAPDRTK